MILFGLGLYAGVGLTVASYFWLKHHALVMGAVAGVLWPALIFAVLKEP